MLNVNFAEKMRGELLEKCGNVEFETLKSYKDQENSIQDVRDQIVAKLPADSKAQLDKLADEYTELIVKMSEEFYLNGFAECLKMLQAGIKP
jgi:hypothetical protein